MTNIYAKLLKLRRFLWFRAKFQVFSIADFKLGVHFRSSSCRNTNQKAKKPKSQKKNKLKKPLLVMITYLELFWTSFYKFWTNALTHLTFTCLKSTIETEEKGVKNKNIKNTRNNKNSRTNSPTSFWCFYCWLWMH